MVLSSFLLFSPSLAPAAIFFFALLVPFTVCEHDFGVQTEQNKIFRRGERGLSSKIEGGLYSTDTVCGLKDHELKVEE